MQELLGTVSDYKLDDVLLDNSFQSLLCRGRSIVEFLYGELYINIYIHKITFKNVTLWCTNSVLTSASSAGK